MYIAPVRAEKDREKISLLIDYSKYSNLTGLSMIRMSLDVLKILSDHYPERLGTAWMVHASWSFSFFWKSISPFLDNVTKKKIFFINKLPELRDWIDEEVLEVEYSGKNEAAYQYEAYKAHEATHFPPYGEDGELLYLPAGASGIHEKKKKKKKKVKEEESTETADEPESLHATSSTSEADPSSNTKSSKKKKKKRSSVSAPTESSHDHSEESRVSTTGDHPAESSKGSDRHEKHSSASLDAYTLDRSTDSETEEGESRKKAKKVKKAKLAGEEAEA